MKRRVFVGRMAGMAAIGMMGDQLWAQASSWGSAPTPITVYKSSTCGCCTAWVEHLEANGFSPVVHDEEEMDKLKKKFAYRHSGFPGGLRARALGDEMEKHADRVVEKAILGMIPHTKLGHQIQKKLKVYVGPDHPHAAQQPIPYEIKQVAQ